LNRSRWQKSQKKEPVATMKKFLALAALAAASTVPSFAATITQWTFETTSAGIAGTSNHIDNISADIGTGIASGVHASASTVWSSPAGNSSSHSFSSTFWASGDYYQFQTSTLGFTGIAVLYDQTGSATGPRDFTLSYSLDGSSFTTVGSTYSVLQNGLAPNPAWGATTGSSAYTFGYDLSSITVLDNASTVYFRVTDMSTTAINGGTVGTGGTDRIDNFIVQTAPIPEPSTVAIGILGGLTGLVIWKRRK
jgi:hypothetical protein